VKREKWEKVMEVGMGRKGVYVSGREEGVIVEEGRKRG
jgi:hypothetical protein